MRRYEVSRRTLLQAGAATTGLTILGPASSRVRAQDTAEIVFWNSTLPFADPADLTKPLEEFYIYQAIARFQEANPGVTVAIENFPGGPELFTKYRTSSVAQTVRM